MTTFHIISIFPEAFDSYINESILKRAQEKKKIKFKFYNPRDFTTNKWRKIDDRPYGGGPGMVMYAEPIVKAIQKALGKKKGKIIFFSPAGKQFTNKLARQYAEKFTDIVFICGRYEGIDARVKKVFKMEEISIGPYVLTGGELAAEVMIDAMTRQIPGVLGTYESLEEERIASSDVYTRPEVLAYKGRKYTVPKVLLSGDQKKIDAWRKKG